MIGARLPSRSAVLVAALALAGPASAKGRAVDQLWIHPGFAGHGVRWILVLPAVTWDENPEASLRTAEAWVDAFSTTAYRWVPPDEFQLGYEAAPDTRDSLMRAITAQVRRSGAIDAATARTLGRRFLVDGILCLRVDRWESGFSAASRHVASIDVHCALVDTAGTGLWRIAGRHAGEGPVSGGPALVPHPRALRTAGGSRRPNTFAARAGDNYRSGDWADVPSIFRDALLGLFTGWVPRLPPAGSRAR